jgi:hypothetical protein
VIDNGYPIIEYKEKKTKGKFRVQLTKLLIQMLLFKMHLPQNGKREKGMRKFGDREEAECSLNILIE